MPKLEDLERLGSIAFLIGNKPLPSEISQEDYDRFKSVFTDERLASVVPDNEDYDLPSIDDIDNTDISLNDDSVLDKVVPSLDDLNLSEDIGLSQNDDADNLDDLGLPEDLPVLDDSDNLDDLNVPKDSGDDNFNDLDLPEDLPVLDNTYDSNVSGDSKVVDNNLDDDIDLPEYVDISSDKIIDDDDNIESPNISEDLDGSDTDDISNAMDDILDDENPSDEDNSDSNTENIEKDIIKDDYDEASSILNSLESSFGDSDIDSDNIDLDSVSHYGDVNNDDSFNNTEDNIPENIEDTTADTMEDLPDENLSSDIDDSVLDALDSSLPDISKKDDEYEISGINDDIEEIEDQNIPEGFDTSENIDDISDIKNIEGVETDDSDSTENALGIIDDEKVLPDPSIADNLGESKYGDLDNGIDIEKVLYSIKELPPLTQHHVLDAILNEKLEKEEMNELLDALDSDAPVGTISNILKSSFGIDTKERGRKSVLDLIPVPNSLKDYAHVIRIAAVFFIGLLAILIFSYQIVYRPLKANQYFKRGMIDISNGSYEEAERNFSRGDRLKPKQIKWYNIYARAYVDRGLFPLALKKIQAALNIKPRDFYTRMTFGYYYRNKGEKDLSADDYSNGESLYDELLRMTKNKKLLEKVYDERGLLMISRARNLNETNYYDEAYNNYRDLVRINGDSVLARKRAMLIRIYQDNYEQVKALEDRINVLKRGYIDDEVYPVLAKYLLDKDEFYGARVLFEKLLRKYPNNIESIVGYADYESRLKHYNKAKDILINTALPLYDKDPYLKGREYVHNMLGQIYYNLGEYGNATRQFNSALAIDGTYPDANYNLANVYFYQDDNYKMAKEHYQIAYANLPPELRSDQLLYNLSWIYYLDKEYDSAFEGFYSIFQKDVSNSVVSYAIGNSLLHLDKPNLANGFYKNSLGQILDKRSRLGNLEMRTDKDFYLISYLAGLYNNIGVAYAYNSATEDTIVNEQEAFKNFVLAGEYFDQVRTSNIALQMREKRTVMLDNQNVGVASYNLMAMQTRRNLKNTVIIDDYIPKDMYYVR